MKWQVRSWLAILLSASLTSPLVAQHEMHDMGMSGGWRMVPMDMSMPMLPGLEGAVPIVAAPKQTPSPRAGRIALRSWASRRVNGFRRMGGSVS